MPFPNDRPQWMYVWRPNEPSPEFNKRRALVAGTTPDGRFITVGMGTYKHAIPCAAPKWWPKEWV